MKYIHRLIDHEIDNRTQAFNAINIVGPKGCGKTRTAKERCKTVIEFQDEDKRAGYLALAETTPSLFLRNETPILFDEWQDAPKIWGTIRKACDDDPAATGSYYLTGSSSKRINTPHTGTGRISEVVMYPMTLFETGESNGSVSLSRLITEADYSVDGAISTLTIEDLIYASCRGGWPRCMELADKDSRLQIARDYCQQIYQKDISALDGVNRNPELAKTILWAYARNMATLVKQTTLLADVQANYNVSKSTFTDYVDVLKRLYVLEDISAWSPQIRSKTAIRTSKKHVFVDPSIAIAALGLSPQYFYQDFDLFGHVFENLVLRDLLAFASVQSAHVAHYSDSIGLEIDAIYQLNDGRYALIEIKTAEASVPQAEQGLLKFRDLIRAHNEKVTQNSLHPGVLYREPSQMLVICANASMAYTLPSGVKIIPIGCLRE